LKLALLPAGMKPKIEKHSNRQEKLIIWEIETEI